MFKDRIVGLQTEAIIEPEATQEVLATTADLLHLEVITVVLRLLDHHQDRHPHLQEVVQDVQTDKKLI